MHALGVARTLAVSSCKGGVGKSSVALRLALALRDRGLQVGLVDADVHGPSLPAMLPPLDCVCLKPNNLVDGRVRPLKALGLECISWGFFPQKRTHYKDSEATVLRGQWAARIAVQMALGTQWGSAAGRPVDVLLFDMPPGTSDVQMSLLNSLPLTAAVTVSTPSPLALCDVKKGIEMLAQVGVPLVALVENFAWLEANVTQTNVCTALQQWLPYMPRDKAADVQQVIEQISRLSLPDVHTGKLIPFGESTLTDLLDLARQSFSLAQGFRLPLTSEMAATTLNKQGRCSENTFALLAEHVHKQLLQFPVVAQQKNSLATGDPSIMQFQSWPRFLYRIKHLHYA